MSEKAYHRPDFRSEADVWTEDEVVELGLAGEEEFCGEMDPTEAKSSELLRPVDVLPPDAVLASSPPAASASPSYGGYPGPINEITKSGRVCCYYTETLPHSYCSSHLRAVYFVLSDGRRVKMRNVECGTKPKYKIRNGVAE